MAQFESVNETIFRIQIPYKDIYTTVLLIKSDRGNILFDAAHKQLDVEDYILPALAQQGVDSIDYIFISHNHVDHSGGLPWLLARFPGCKVISRSKKLAEKYPETEFVLPEDGDIFWEHFQVITIPGHTVDSAALLDKRTGTLITGDCLQVYGIWGSQPWGAVIRLIQPHLQAIEKLRTMDIQAIAAAHDYHPYGNYAAGKEAVNAYLDGCVDALCRIRDILKDNLDFEDMEVTAMCNDGKQPAVPAEIVGCVRKAMEEGQL